MAAENDILANGLEETGPASSGGAAAMIVCKTGSIFRSRSTMVRTGIYSSRSRERFGDIAIGHLIDDPSLSRTDFAVYSDVVVALLDSSNELSDLARSCSNIDDHYALTRLGLERESLAMLLLLRLEQLGLKLSIRSSPFYPYRRFMRELLRCSIPRNYWLVSCLERVEERLRQKFHRALSDLRLAPAIKEMLVDAFHRAEPGKALRQRAATYGAQPVTGCKSGANHSLRSSRQRAHPASDSWQIRNGIGCGHLLNSR